jgi:hypothetical protein
MTREGVHSLLKTIDRTVAKHLDGRAIRDNQGSAGLARQAPALQTSLHANIIVLDQPG